VYETVEIAVNISLDWKGHSLVEKASSYIKVEASVLPALFMAQPSYPL
jgi:hypothetical protein